MRIDNNDIRAMPLHMQEQLGTKILAQMAQANRVAEAQEEYKLKRRVRRLRFHSREAAIRYLCLRGMVREGSVTDLILHLDGGYVRSFSYLIMEEC